MVVWDAAAGGWEVEHFGDWAALIFHHVSQRGQREGAACCGGLPVLDGTRGAAWGDLQREGEAALCGALYRLVLLVVCRVCSLGVHLEGRNWASLW